MPLYEYECKQCGRRTEKRQKFSDPEITECPYCKGTLERVISAPAIAFKGSGWYKDLYSSPKPAAAGGSSASSDSAGAGSGGSSENAGTTPAPASTPASGASSPAPAAPAAKPAT